MKRRILAGLLALVMLLGCVPAMSIRTMAVEPESTETVETIAPAETVSVITEENIPEETASAETTVPAETTPAETVPAETVSETTPTEVTTPTEDTAPVDTTPTEGTTPKDAAPTEGTTPTEEPVPEETEAAVPTESVPVETIPENTTPTEDTTPTEETIAEAAEGTETENSVSGVCGENLTWTLDEAGTLTISGTGDMWDYVDADSREWAGYIGRIQKVTISEGVTGIGDWAFAGFSGMKEAIIPNTVTRIGSHAFDGCASLTVLTIPESVTGIGDEAFVGCASLTELTLPTHLTPTEPIPEEDAQEQMPEETPVAPTILTWEAYRYTLLADGTVSICGFEGAPENEDEPFLVEIPSEVNGSKVTEIAEKAFAGNAKIEAILLPETIEAIGSGAFEDCGNLKVIAFCGEAPSFGGSLVKGSEKLEEIDILEKWDFSALTQLLEKDLGENAAANITFQSYETVASLEETFAAQNQPEPEESERIEDDTGTQTGQGYVTYTTGEDDGAEDDTIVASGTCGDDLVWRLDRNGVLTISGTGEMQEGYPWFDKKDYIKSAIIEEGVTSIGAYVFYGCSSLSTVEIPESVTYIGDNAFYQCESLASVIIPDGVAYIGHGAFFMCSSLASITIPGGAHLQDGYYTGLGIFQQCYQLREVTLLEGITSIPSKMFAHCSSLCEVKLPNSLKYIRGEAFGNCTSLKELKLPDSIIDLQARSFDGCSELCKVNFPLNWTSVTNYRDSYTSERIGGVFRDCTKLEEIYVPDGVTAIPRHAFSDSKIIKITLPNSLIKIDEYAFLNCTCLREITIPGSVEEIRDYAFSSCRSLTSVTFQDGIQSIGSWLSGCSRLTYVVIPQSVTSIGYSAFDNCTSLTDIYYAGSKAEWSNINGHIADDSSGVTIHYNSTGPDAGDVDGDVRYFRNWDAENQIAHWGEVVEVEGLNLGSQVTEETDTSFLENVDNLVGTYVLAKTRIRNDGMIGPDILLSIKPVETRVGIITSLENGLEIDGVRYPYDGVLLTVEEVGDKIRYYVCDGVIVGELTQITSKSTASNNPDYGSGGWEGASSPADPADSYLYDYQDEWLDAYKAYMKAVEQTLNDYVGKTLTAKNSVIASEAKRMQENDEKSYSRYLTGEFEEYADNAYLALATFFYEKIDSQGIDFASVDLSSKKAEANLVNKVMKGFNGGSETYTFGKVRYTIKTFGYGSVSFGSMTIKDGSKAPITVVVCSTQDDCKAAIGDFLLELRDLSTNAAANVVTALSKDIFGKNLYELTEDYLTDVASRIERRFAVQLSSVIGTSDVDGLFQASGVGQLFNTINECYSYYQFSKEARSLLEKANSDPFEAINKMQSIQFKDTTVKDGAVKKAMSSLRKASNNLNSAFNDYVAGTLVKKEEGFWRQFRRIFNINCPVSVAVYNSSGVQIGYVDDAEIQYTDELIISRNGESKRIVMLTDDIPTLKITATDYGTMSCSFEEYNENGYPIGRLNFYDIPLVPEQEFSVAVKDNIEVNADAFTIQSGDECIFADAYIPAERDAGVAITCDVTGADGAAVHGTGMYVQGDSVALSVDIPAGYEFLGWFDGESLLSTNAIYEFVAKTAKDLSAKFRIDDSVYVSTSASDGGVAFGGGVYTKGATVNLVAFSYTGYLFEGWYVGEEAVSKNEEYSFIADSDITVTANFVPHTHAFSAPVFTWTETASCSAEFTCTSCGYAQVVECTITSSVEGTKTRYTATVEFNGQTYTDTITSSAEPAETADINGDGAINVDDVFYLAMHISAPGVFAIPWKSADVNGDGVVNVDDVFYLAMHISAPQVFPLFPSR